MMFKNNNYQLSPNNMARPLSSVATTLFTKNNTNFQTHNQTNNRQMNTRKTGKNSFQNIDLQCDEVLQMPPISARQDDLVCNEQLQFSKENIKVQGQRKDKKIELIEPQKRQVEGKQEQIFDRMKEVLSEYKERQYQMMSEITRLNHKIKRLQEDKKFQNY